MMLSNTDYADSFCCSGTEEEENLLAAHLGIFDAHVHAFAEHTYQQEYAAFCAEIEGSDDFYATADDDIPF